MHYCIIIFTYDPDPAQREQSHRKSALSNNFDLIVVIRAIDPQADGQIQAIYLPT